MNESAPVNRATPQDEEGGVCISPNTLKSEHLNEGIQPIMTCVGIRQRENYENLHLLRMDIGDRSTRGYKVNFFASEKTLEEKGFKSAGKKTYVISPIDSLNKYSEKIYDCTGLVVIGHDRRTGRDVSFLSHQDPGMFLAKKRSQFILDIEDRLGEIMEYCEPGTIDAVVVGGNKTIKGEYEESIELLTEEVEKTLGFKPVVIAGPKLGVNHDTVLFDTDKRRLYFFRPYNRDIGKSFVVEEDTD